MINAQPTPLRDDDRTPSWGWLVEVATWIGAGVGAFLLLVLCSELALAEGRIPASLDIPSRTRADYSPWPNSLVHRVQAQIVGAILQDRDPLAQASQDPGMMAIVPGTFWSTKAVPDVAADTPRSTPSPDPEPRETTTPPFSSTATCGSTAALTGIPSRRRTLAGTGVPSPASMTQATDTPMLPLAVAPSPTATNLQVGGTFWLHNDTNPLAYMMSTSAPDGSEQSVSWMVANRFHSPPFESGASLPAGTTTLHIYVSNTSPTNSTIGMTLYAGEGSYTLLGSNTGSVPGGTTTPSVRTFSFNTGGYAFSEGQRLKLEVYSSFGLTIYWDGQYSDTRVIIP